MRTTLEHINITVSDPQQTAAMLVDLFGWIVRWEGPSKLGGNTIHVGGPQTGDDYLAVYTTPGAPGEPQPRENLGGMNHIGVLVEDLDATEQRILAAGFHTHTHGDYDPGRRFYFDDHDGIEYEVISYTEQAS